MNFLKAQTKKEIAIVQDLFVEYFFKYKEYLGNQDFDKELNKLPGKYKQPRGCLVLAMQNEIPAGCVGLKPFSEDTCEMGRLYVKDEFRSQKVGLKLVEIFIKEARMMGYKKVFLDTVPEFDKAIKLYESFGFHKRSPYYVSEIKNPIYMELEL